MNLAQRLIQAFLEEFKAQGHKPTLGMTLHIQGIAPDVHYCTSHREGPWIIWRCPVCQDYERRFNLETGQMRCVGHESGIVHTGTSSAAQNMEALTMNIQEN